MSVHSFGTVTVSLTTHLDIPEEAGNLTDTEIRRCVAPPKGIGKACQEAAAAMEKTAGQIAFAPSVSADLVRDLGRQAEEVDQVIADIRVLLHRFKQANTVMDDKAYRHLRRIYSNVKSEAAFNPNLKKAFEPLYDYFSTLGAKKGAAPIEDDAALNDEDITAQPVETAEAAAIQSA